MPQDPFTIVSELIEIDPSLEPHRAMLELNVRSILVSRPDTQFSTEFKQRLLRELTEKLDLVQPSTPHSLMIMVNKFLYTGAGAVVGGLLVFFVSRNLPMPGLTTPEPESGKKAVDVAVDAGDAVQGDVPSQPLPPKAFGDLPQPQAHPTISARPQSAGGGAGGATGMEGMEYREESGTDAKMIAPVEPGMYQPISVDFIYKGEITLPEDDVLVMRREMPKTEANASLLKGTFASSLIDVSKLPNLPLQSVNLGRTDFGSFNVTVDFLNGTVSMYKNIDYSSRPESTCSDEACFARYRVKMSDIPSEKELFAMTDKFMKEYAIDRRNLGEPMTQDDWRYWYETSTDKTNYWFPEQLSVIYPYEINGKPVFDEWGNPVGVNVTFDIRENGVTGVWGLQTMDFTSSSYTAADDLDAVMKVVRKGGRNEWRDPAAKIVEASVKEPVDVYVQINVWDQKSMFGETLYVPAVAFPVTSMPMEAGLVRKYVVVPLAKEFLTVPQDPVGIPRPMPLMEGAAG
ncbi:hypothetical protein FJZ28_01640 [Candidatus Peregrinibacteria bacterium]|nr:hypothetical protein [Candidatus Peregrinibacteria bacterium]